MNDLMAELAEVVRLSEAATTGEWRARPDDAVVILGGNRGGFCINECPDASGNAALIAAAVNFIRTHHAEIAEAVNDAERWRALHWAEAPMVTVTGSQLARGIRPGDFAVPWDWPVTSKTRIRMIVMSNSAREVGE